MNMMARPEALFFHFQVERVLLVG